MEYKGIKWSNCKNLAKKLGLPESKIKAMKSAGKTYEEIIDSAMGKNKNKKEVSYKGISWSSNRDLSKKLGRYPSFVAYRLSKGETYEEIIDNFMAKMEKAKED